jgi:hypothetical protein
MKGQLSEEKLSLRVPASVLKRADALVEKIGKSQKLTVFGRVTRSGLIKLALSRGLEALEKEYK